LEEEYNQKLKIKEREIRKLDIQVEKMKMSEYNLNEYQSQRVRALTQIMQEVIKDDYKPDKDQIAKLFGIDKIIENGNFLNIYIF
jgi:anthranilate phosphoribosyltransferase